MTRRRWQESRGLHYKQ